MLKVPLSEPERLQEVTGGVVSQSLNLPTNLNPELIFLYPRRLQKLTRSVGAKSLHLAFDNEMPVADYSDVQEIGGGLAALKGLKKPGYRGSFEYDDSHNPRVSRVHEDWGQSEDPAYISEFKADKLTLWLPREDIRYQAQENQPSQSQERSWAVGLNRGIKAGLSEAVTFRFAGDSIQPKKFESRNFIALGDVSVPQIAGALFGALSESFNTQEALLLSNGFYFGALPVFGYLLARHDGLDPVFRFFLVSGMDKEPRARLRINTIGKLVSHNTNTNEV